MLSTQYVKVMYVSICICWITYRAPLGIDCTHRMRWGLMAMNQMVL